MEKGTVYMLTTFLSPVHTVYYRLPAPQEIDLPTTSRWPVPHMVGTTNVYHGLDQTVFILNKPMLYLFWINNNGV